MCDVCVKKTLTMQSSKLKSPSSVMSHTIYYEYSQNLIKTNTYSYTPVGASRGGIHMYMQSRHILYIFTLFLVLNQWLTGIIA